MQRRAKKGGKGREGIVWEKSRIKLFSGRELSSVFAMASLRVWSPFEQMWFGNES